MEGANTLALMGYSNIQIQKMGRWRGATFKEYICKEMINFSEGMSKDMNHKFGFMNIVMGVFVDVTDTMVGGKYSTTPDFVVTM